MLTDRSDVETFLKNYFIIHGKYNISDNGVVDVNGYIALNYEKFNEDGFTELLKESNEIRLPIQFGHVKGYFCFENSNITTMKGFPLTVTISCSINNSKQLTSLEFSPKCFYFVCYECKQITSLDGLNCEDFSGSNLNLENFGTNFKAKVFDFNNFKTPTALKKHTEEFSMLDEMRHLITLNPKISTAQEAPWIKLIKDYSRHKDMFKAAQEFESLYNEPLIKPENKIEINQYNDILSL